MSHLALYREWRPKTFDEVVEQKHVVYALRQAVISGQIAHAYLFSGTRGTGKTTLAKIFSRAINCLDPQQGNPCNQCEICLGILDGSLLDVIEMDAASNNSVDNIRRICDEVVFMPSQARFKVYIIDEVHMLSTGAFNALLKTLEEPPAHAVFILATTEPHRIPATILSRCQRYDFRRIPVESMVLRLAEIAQADGINLTTEALEAMASLSDGALRDAISLLDQAKASIPGCIGRDDVLRLAGIVQDDFMQKMAQAMLDGNVGSVLRLVDELVMAGRDLARFVTDLAQYFRNLLICRISEQPQKLVQATTASLEAMRRLSQQVNQQGLITWIQALSEMLLDLRWAGDTRTLLEIGLIRLMSEQDSGLTAGAVLTAAPSDTQQEDRTKPTSFAPVVPVAPAVPAASVATTSAPVSIAPTITASASAPAAPTVPASAPDSALPAVPTLTSVSAPVAPVLSETLNEDTDQLPEAPPDWDEAPGNWEPEEFVPDKIAFSDTASGKSGTTSGDAETATEPPESDTKKTIGKIISAEPAPVDPVQADPVSAEPAPVEQVQTIWQETLQQLLMQGNMDLNLFAQPAAVSLCGPVFNIVFAETQPVHYQEISRPLAQKLILQILQKITGQDLTLSVQITSNPQKTIEQCVIAEDEWISKIRQTADQFGIPVKMEE